MTKWGPGDIYCSSNYYRGNFKYFIKCLSACGKILAEQKCHKCARYSQRLKMDVLRPPSTEYLCNNVVMKTVAGVRTGVIPS